MSVELCCFPVEIKVRGLHARLYLAMKLAGKNFGCLIGPKAGVHQAMFAANVPFLYFSKGARLHGVELFEKIRGAQGHIAYLDEEGAFYSRSWRKFEEKNLAAVLKHIEIYFAWGSKQRDVLLARDRGVSEDRIFVTGHPRFDLRKRQFSSAYGGLASKTVGDRAILLMNTNFGKANSGVPLADQIACVERRSQESVEREYYRARYDYDSQLTRHFIDLARYLGQRFQKHLIVVRPHPTEKVEVYSQRLGEFNNVIISKDHTVQEWIVHASAVIHHDCTTGVEARFFKTPVITYRPTYDSDIVTEIPSRIGVPLTNPEQVAHHIDNTQQPQQMTDDEKRLVGGYIANVDFNSADRISETVAAVFSTPRAAPPIPFRKYRKQESSRSKSKRIPFWLSKKRPGLNVSPELNSSATRKQPAKFDSLTGKELRSLITAFRRADETIPELEFRQVEKDTFYLQRAAA